MTRAVLELGSTWRGMAHDQMVEASTAGTSSAGTLIRPACHSRLPPPISRPTLYSSVSLFLPRVHHLRPPLSTNSVDTLLCTRTLQTPADHTPQCCNPTTSPTRHIGQPWMPLYYNTRPPLLPSLACPAPALLISCNASLQPHCCTTLASLPPWTLRWWYGLPACARKPAIVLTLI